MTTLEYFDIYVRYGLHVIPLYPNSKIPVWKKWNQGYDEERCRKYLLANPASNLGLLLGEFVDVESDTPEAEAMLDQLIGKYVHPHWRSHKSVHHLFLNPDPKLTSTRFLGMEFRAFKHQSALPPSLHKEGVQYYWKHIHFPIPAMPPALAEYYFKNRPAYPKGSSRRKSRKLLPDGIMLTQCKTCMRKEKIHRERLRLEVRAFAELDKSWECHKCRVDDVRPACRRIRTELRRTLPVAPKVGSKKRTGYGDILAG